MSLATELQQTLEGFKQNAPEDVKGPINAAREEIQASFNRDGAIHEGDTLPEFKLQNALGEEVSSKELLKNGPLLFVSLLRSSPLHNN